MQVAFRPALEKTVMLEPDPAVPQRDLLLDEGEIATRLSAQLCLEGSIKIDRCERRRVKYRVGDSLRVLYEIEFEGGRHFIAARTFAEEKGSRVFHQASRNALARAPFRPLVFDADLNTLFWIFPNDRKLKNLRLLDEVPARLASFVGWRWTKSHVVAYAPERSATAQCLDHDNSVVAYAKLYAGDEGRNALRIYDWLNREARAQRSELLIPNVIGYSTDDRILLLEAVDGLRINEIAEAELALGMRRLGSALATLHSLRPPAQLPHFKRLAPDRLQSTARIIGRARPDVSSLADGLALRLRTHFQASSSRRVCVHGDVHLKNGIVRNGHLALIDFDQAGLGPAAADLGSLLAALRYDQITDLISKRVECELATSFLSGYAATESLPDEPSLRWHTAAALFAERALRTVNRIRPEGLERLHELLIEGARILDRGWDD